MIISLADPNLVNPRSKVSEATEIIEAALNMGLEVLGGKEAGIKAIEKKLVDGEI